jgi:hypothetical protein
MEWKKEKGKSGNPKAISLLLVIILSDIISIRH